MSAIAGILDLNSNDEIAEQLFLSMKRRGPAGKSSYYENGKMILHTSSSNDCCDEIQATGMDRSGEHYLISFDGVIFNKEEVRRILQKEGHLAADASDAELMLQGYVCFQEEFLNYVNGTFAFAILCEKEGKVILCRDRMGVKPLFYKKHEKGLIFASEMKTILSYPGVEAQLDTQGVAEILLLGPGRTPGSGVFRDIHELEPGCYGIYQNGNLQLRRYWKLRDRAHTDSFEKTLEHVRYLVMDSVQMQMQVNGTVGTMLSGGLDSSLVSAICAREMDSKGKRLDTYSLDYQDNDKYFVPGRFQPNSDTQFIRIMQEDLDSQHHWTVLTPDDLVAGICDATIARDLPGMADVDTSLLAFCKKIKSHSNIVLSGECADEIFGGYPWYRDPEMRDEDGFPWAKTTAERTHFLHSWFTDQICPEEFLRSRYQQTVMESDIMPENNPQERRIKELVNLNFRWFMQTLLERGDRMGAFCDLEIRVPFCDYRIAEYLYGVPWAFKDYKGFEKGLLRRAMEGILPHSVLYRKKSPFPKTHDPHYLEIVSQLLLEVLKDKNAPILQLVRKEALTELLEQDFRWPWYGQLMRRPQTIVYMLQINFWLQHYSVKIV